MGYRIEINCFGDEGLDIFLCFVKEEVKSNCWYCIKLFLVIWLCFFECDILVGLEFLGIVYSISRIMGNKGRSKVWYIVD